MFPNPFSFLQTSATGATEFIIKVKTDNTGSSNNDQFTIPTTTGTYDYTVDWGDTPSTIDSNVTGNITHTYAAGAGEYEIKISGTFPRIFFNSTGDAEKLLEIVNWGNNPWTSMDRAFYDCINMDITATDAPDFSNATSFYQTFRGCTSMTTTGTSADWVANTCTNNEYMLYNCQNLLTCDASNWDMSSSTSFYWMFYNCKVLTTLDVSNWVTSSLGTGGKAGTALFHAFDRCEALTTIDASGWDVSNVTVFQQMFKNCYALNNLTVTEWDMSSAVSTTEMFRDCQALTSLDLGSWEPSSLITTQSMFYGCDVLTTIGDISGWITGNITNAQYMFYGCDALTVDVIGLTFGAGNISSMFQGASGTGEVSGYETWDVSNATQFQYVFYGGNNCKVFPETWNMTSSINNLGTFRNWNTLTGSIDCSAMEFGPTTQMSQMFRRLPNSTALTDITFGPDCDFSATTTLDYFLSGHTGLTDITWDAAVSFAALTRANTMLTSGGKMSVSSYDHFLDRMQVTWSAAITPVAPLGCGSSQYTKSILTTGTATSTTANKLVDSGKDFSASGLNVQIGDIVFDDTGNDYAKVTAVDNATTLSLNADIIISGDAYEIDQGAAAKDKEYLIDNGWTIVDANGTSP